MQMKIWIFGAAVAALLLAGTADRPAGATAKSSDARRAISANYRRFTAAESTLDYAQIKAAADEVIAPDFMLHTATGHTLDHKKFLNEMELTTHEVLKVHKNTFYTAGLTQKGDTLKENGIYVFTRKALDVDAAFGKLNARHLVSERMEYRATWIKSGTAWRLQTLRFLSDKVVVDGKPHKLV